MTPYNVQTANLVFQLLNKLGPLVAKKLNGTKSTSIYCQGTILSSFIPMWFLIMPKSATFAFQLLNKLGPLVAKNPKGPLGTSINGQGPILPSFIPIWPFIMPKTANSAFRLLNKLAPWWPKQKNKTTFIIKIPPICINKVALFSPFDPFKRPIQPFGGSGY